MDFTLIICLMILIVLFALLAWVISFRGNAFILEARRPTATVQGDNLPSDVAMHVQALEVDFAELRGVLWIVKWLCITGFPALAATLGLSLYEVSKSVDTSVIQTRIGQLEQSADQFEKLASQSGEASLAKAWIYFRPRDGFEGAAYHNIKSVSGGNGAYIVTFENELPFPYVSVVTGNTYQARVENPTSTSLTVRIYDNEYSKGTPEGGGVFNLIVFCKTKAKDH
jgi:hypothetical protein